MRILLLQSSAYLPSLGGANKANRLLLEQLAARGHECHTVGTAGGDRVTGRAACLADLVAAGVEGAAPLPGQPGVIAFRHAGVAVEAVLDGAHLRARAAQRLRELAPDRVLVSSEDPAQVLLEEAVGASPHAVYLAHTTLHLPFGPDGFLQSPGRTALLRRTAGIIAVSGYVRDYFERWAGLEATLLRFPVYGAEPFPELGDFDRGFVTLINPCAVKGLSIFLELARHFPDVAFAAVPTWGTTREDRTALAALPNVCLLPSAAAIDEIFAQTRVLLAPSLWGEAFGQVAIEAMLRAIPVLASNAGGLPEAKLGVDYVLPVRPIERYEERFDERKIPVPVVPAQGLAPWKEALRQVLGDRELYGRLSRDSRRAALDFVSGLGIGPFQEYLERLPTRIARLGIEPYECLLAGLVPKAPTGAKPSSQADVRGKLQGLSTEKLELLARRLQSRKQGGPPAQATIPRLPRPDGGGSFPLSFTQLRMWFLHQLEPESPVYNESFGVRLRGRLDAPALAASLREIVRRHEALRTRFEAVDECDAEPIQIVSPVVEGTFPGLPAIDLSALGALVRSREAERLAAAERWRPFDLSRGPLLRVALVRLAAEEHHLLITVHHITADMWAIGVMIGELSALYAAFHAGRPSPLPALPVQYADYAVWQRQWLTGERLDGLLAWWQERLAGLAPVLDLPGDRPRPAVQSFRGGSVPVALSRSLAEALHEFARRDEATLFIALLAGFQAFLYRATGQDDLAVGSPIANRGRREVEGLIGCFINTLVLRGDLSGRPTVRELLARARAAALGAYAHQDLPFERLVDHLQPERSLSHGPLFQVMLLLQNTPGSGLALPELTTASLPVPEGVAKLDLLLPLMEVADGSIQGSLDYSRDLFDPPTAARLLTQLVCLLAGMAADPDRRIAELPLLSAAERRQLLDWNARAPEAVPERTLTALFEAQAARAPEAPALRLAGESWTYGDLNRRANRLARHLRRRGVGPEARVGVLLERSLEMVSSLLAILKAGGAYVPLDPAAPVERLAFLCRDSGIATLITAGQRELPSLPEPATWTVVDLGAIVEDLAEEDDRDLVPLAAPDSLCYVIYTSGSTGLPKGVLVRHGSVARLLSSTERWFSFGPRDVWTLFHSYTFDFSVWELWGALAYGGRLVVVPYWVSRSPAAFWRLLLEEGVTVLNQTPSAFRQLLQEDGEAGPAERERLALRLVIFGGEALDLGSLRPWYERHAAALPRLVNMYGITETTVHVSYRPLGPADLREPQRSPIGEALPDLGLRLLGPGLELVPLGVAGEICVGGAGLARGYQGRPELTAERFVPDPYGASGERLYRSGDLARYRANGELDYLGRRDHQVKIRGFRIELGEIEAALAAHPEVREAVVAALTEEAEERRLVAYVVASPATGAAPEARQLRAYLKERLPEHMVPAAFVLLPSLPLTPNGKVDRGALPAPHPRRPEFAGGAAPRTPVEETLARIWAEVLRVERAGVHENFFDLGGDSILSIQLVSRARRAGIFFTPREVFEHQTIAELASVARLEERAEAGQSLVTGPLPLTPIQRWWLEAEPLDLHHFNQSVLLASRAPLHPAALARAVDRLVAHHDALRLRLERGEAGYAGDPGWRQRIAGLDGPRPFAWADLSALPQPRVAGAVEEAAAAAQASLDLARGPLVRFVAFGLGEGRPGWLLIIVHHWAVDGVSWRILLEDLVSAYVQAARGEAIELPGKSTSYRDWALWLEKAAGTMEVERELAHWQEMAPASELPRLAPAARRVVDTVAGVCSVSLALGAADTAALLREVPEVYRTRIDEVLLAALGRAFALRRGERSLLVDVEGHGREEKEAGLDLSRTVGWFTVIYPVLLRIAEPADPAACIRAVKESLRRVPGHGIGYGLLRYLRADAADISAARVRALPRAEIVFNYLGQLDQALPAGAPFVPAREARGSENSSRNRRPYLLEVSGSIAGGSFETTWTYSSQLLAREEVAGLAAAFLDSLGDIVRHGRSRQAIAYTPADFPEVALTEKQLALALGEIDLE